jgi:hypothetical protein
VVSSISRTDAELEDEATQPAADAVWKQQLTDTSTWFCANDRCPAFVARMLIRADRLHLTAVASTALAPFLRKAWWAGYAGHGERITDRPPGAQLVVTETSSASLFLSPLHQRWST